MGELLGTRLHDGGLAARTSAERIDELERALEAKETEMEEAKTKATAYVEARRPPRVAHAMRRPPQPKRGQGARGEQLWSRCGAAGLARFRSWV